MPKITPTTPIIGAGIAHGFPPRPKLPKIRKVGNMKGVMTSPESLLANKGAKQVGKYAELKKFAGDAMKRFMTQEGRSNQPGAPEKVDSKQLAMGIKVEMEHTKDPKVARKIAMDHLSEFAHYYTALAKMERELKSAKDEVVKGDKS